MLDRRFWFLVLYVVGVACLLAAIFDQQFVNYFRGFFESTQQGMQVFGFVTADGVHGCIGHVPDPGRAEPYRWQKCPDHCGAGDVACPFVWDRSSWRLYGCTSQSEAVTILADSRTSNKGEGSQRRASLPPVVTNPRLDLPSNRSIRFAPFRVRCTKFCTIFANRRPSWQSLSQRRDPPVPRSCQLF